MRGIDLPLRYTHGMQARSRVSVEEVGWVGGIDLPSRHTAPEWEPSGVTYVGTLPMDDRRHPLDSVPRSPLLPLVQAKVRRCPSASSS